MQTTRQSLSLTHLVRPPAQAAENAPPLLLLLHGVGSNEQDLMALAPYFDNRFFVVSVRAPITLPTGGYGWYPVQWTPNGPVGDPDRARQSRDAILSFVNEAVAAYGLDAHRVFLAGFSQGAIMSLYVALTHPERVRAIAPMSGRLLPEAWAERAGDDRLRGLPIFAVHGTRDTVLPIGEGREIRDKLSTVPVALTYTEYPMAHEVSTESLADVAAFLTSQLNAKG